MKVFACLSFFALIGITLSLPYDLTENDNRWLQTSGIESLPAQYVSFEYEPSNENDRIRHDLQWENQQYERVIRHRRDSPNGAQVTVEHGRTGTDLNAEARARLYESANRRTTIDSAANYQQHWGGQAGRQRDYGASVRFNHKF